MIPLHIYIGNFVANTFVSSMKNYWDNMLFYAVLLFLLSGESNAVSANGKPPVYYPRAYDDKVGTHHFHAFVPVCTQESAFVSRNLHLSPGIGICIQESAFVPRNRHLYPGIGAAFVSRMSALIVFEKFICVFYVQDL